MPDRSSTENTYKNLSMCEGVGDVSLSFSETSSHYLQAAVSMLMQVQAGFAGCLRVDKNLQ